MSFLEASMCRLVIGGFLLFFGCFFLFFSFFLLPLTCIRNVKGWSWEKLHLLSRSLPR